MDEGYGLNCNYLNHIYYVLRCSFKRSRGVFCVAVDRFSVYRLLSTGLAISPASLTREPLAIIATTIVSGKESTLLSSEVVAQPDRTPDRVPGTLDRLSRSSARTKIKNAFTKILAHLIDYDSHSHTRRCPWTASFPP